MTKPCCEVRTLSGDSGVVTAKPSATRRASVPRPATGRTMTTDGTRLSPENASSQASTKERSASPAAPSAQSVPRHGVKATATAHQAAAGGSGSRDALRKRARGLRGGERRSRKVKAEASQSVSLKKASGGTLPIIEAFANRPHIFNLGHGIVPETPIEHVARLVELVKGRG